MTKYDSVKEYLRSRIASGELRPGDRIPTEDELIQRLGVSRNPVRRALSDLAQDGVIFTLRGSGSYVRKTTKNDTITVYVLLYTENRRFESELIRGMRVAVDEHPDNGIELVLKKPGRNTREMIEVLSTLDTSRSGGVVFLPVLDNDRTTNRMLGAALRSIAAPRFAAVQLDRYVPEYDGTYVMSDHVRGAQLLTNHLLENGHREIAVYYEHPENTSVAMRIDAIRKAMNARGLELAKERVIHLPYQQVSRLGRRLLRQGFDDGVTALLCLENAIAFEFARISERIGLRVPEDISLCSFDDHSFDGEYRDFLTCVLQPLERIGFLAVDIVLKNLHEPLLRPVQTVLEPSLVIRRSVGRR